MKIVHVVDYLMPKMGYQELLLPKWNARHGHEVHIITSDRFSPVPDYDQTWGKLLGPRICGTGITKIYDATLHRLPCTWEWKERTWISGLKSKIKQLNPDVIFCHGSGSPTAMRVSAFCKRFGMPLLMDNHMVEAAKNNRISGRIYYSILKLTTKLILTRGVNCFLGVAEECCDFLAVEQGIPRSKIENLPLGVDTDVLHVDDAAGAELRAKLNIPLSAKVVLQTGKLSTDKGPHILSQAMGPVMKQNPDAWLVFLGAGEGDYLNTVLKPLKENEVMDRVKIIPFVPFSGLAEYYNMSDLCVYPAAASMSCLEAAACGKCVIMADLPVGKWRAEKGVGLCYREGNIEELKEIITQLLFDDKRRLTIGQQAQKSVLAHFSYDKIANQAEELMCRAITHQKQA
jgi:glycosyltransferase involved in cell wall biosynthesis